MVVNLFVLDWERNGIRCAKNRMHTLIGGYLNQRQLL